MSIKYSKFRALEVTAWERSVARRDRRERLGMSSGEAGDELAPRTVFLRLNSERTCPSIARRRAGGTPRVSSRWSRLRDSLRWTCDPSPRRWGLRRPDETLPVPTPAPRPYSPRHAAWAVVRPARIAYPAASPGVGAKRI
jgi:hypothetical protein